MQSHWDADLHGLSASSLLEGAEREMMAVAGAPYRLADPLSKIAGHYAAIIVDTRLSFSLLTEMALVAASDAIIPVEPRYLETVGMLSVLSKINDIREGWRHPELRVGGILVTKMDTRVKGHNRLLEKLKAHKILGRMLYRVIPANEAVSYAHRDHRSVFSFDPKAPASKAYAHMGGKILRQMAKRTSVGRWRCCEAAPRSLFKMDSGVYRSCGEQRSRKSRHHRAIR